jgi:hypothetical protein
MPCHGGQVLIFAIHVPHGADETDVRLARCKVDDRCWAGQKARPGPSGCGGVYFSTAHNQSVTQMHFD